MKKKFGILIALLMTISLLLVPATVMAEEPGDSVGLGVGVYDATLTLENKDAAWEIIGSDTIGATLGYNYIGSEFVWRLDGKVVESNTDYALIYYADMPDRYTDWGGDNPGALIALVTSDANGYISDFGSIELGMDLPCPPDANQFEIDYGIGAGTTGDDYNNVHGAKIWLVPESVLPANWPDATTPWLVWSPDDILFETDLITYDDGDEVSSIVSISVNPTTIDFGILTPGDTGQASITLTSGNVPIDVAVLTGLTGVFENLKLDSGVYSSYKNSILANDSEPVAASITVPTEYKPTGSETGTLTFIATPTP